MQSNYSVRKTDLDQALKELSSFYDIYAPISKNDNIDYWLLNPSKDVDTVYNEGRPLTPLKTFFLPIKENVARESKNKKPRVVIGVPACDLAALDLLDKIYLDETLVDVPYKANRDNTVIIASDCYAAHENCHCTAYDINPYPEKNFDISLSGVEDKIYLNSATEKGDGFLNELKKYAKLETVENLPEEINSKREAVKKQLNDKNRGLANLEECRKIVTSLSDAKWSEYADKCVSCGACSTICPTCHCFLLIDRPDFEKVRNWDSCQYPGFQRVAGGEDPLEKHYDRFKNRFFCKFIHKPNKFGEIACTGCGRCIDACIGGINKNDILK